MRIEQSHLYHFTRFLSELEPVVRIDIPQFRKNLGVLLKWSFPPKGKLAVLIATSETERDRFRPFQPRLALIFPPHYLSREVPIMEFTLNKMFVDSDGPVGENPIALAVYPSGRRVACIFGLTLDTKGKKTKYESGTMTIDHDVIAVNHHVEAVVMHLLNTFKIEEGSKEQARLKTAMEDYNRNQPMAG